jgi:hypothetical protein
VRWSEPQSEGFDAAGFEKVGLRFAVQWA